MGLAEHLPSRNSRIVKWGGYVLLLVALGYCGLAIARLGTDEILAALSPRAWFATGLVGIAYGAMLCLLAVSWVQEAAKTGPLDLRQSLAVYGPGVIAKYIPGSVFQYGSRQLLGAERGLAQKDLAKASLFEAGLHVPSSLIAAGVLFFGGSYSALFLAITIAAAMLVVRDRRLVVAVGCQLAFFLGFGLLVAALAEHAIGVAAPDRLAAMFMLAWLAGFLVPVAPGGIGVRESALLALAGTIEPAGTVAAFALLTRLATSLGDAAFGLSGYWALFSARWNRQASG